MNNSKQWSSATPGYLIFLVDQSGSMKSNYSGSESKAEFTAAVINRTINEIINTNMDGDKVKDRVFISLIGYGASGSSVDDLRSDYLSEFSNSHIRIEKRQQKVPDGNGGLVDIEVEAPIFLEPKGNGLTPMGAALDFAKQLIEKWVSEKPENPAPVIINISDGLPTDDENFSEKIAGEIMNIQTNDGNPLIFNIHIGNGTAKHEFANDENILSDEQSKFLFRISSVVPDSYKANAVKHQFEIEDQSRGFVSNADPITMTKFINFGSSGGVLDRN